MWDLRRQVSLLLSEGHLDARDYPVHRVWEESSLVVGRINHRLATEALLIQMAVSSLFAESSGKEFKELMTSMTDGS